MAVVPRKTSYRLSDEGLTRLDKIAELLGTTKTEALERAITHTLASLLREDRLWMRVPEFEVRREPGLLLDEPEPPPEPPKRSDGWERQS